ncbi:MAG: hypothetical protein ACLPV8_08780 [Steroidobacteraceae bacterium]
MPNPYFDARIYLADGGAKTICHVVIDEPELTADGDAACRVRLTPLLQTDKEIFGADEAQAKTLAVAFVKRLLAGKSLTNMNGSRIEIADSEDLIVFK